MHPARSACGHWRGSSSEPCATRSPSPPCSASSTPRVPCARRRTRTWCRRPCSRAQAPSGSLLCSLPGPTEASALSQVPNTASGPPPSPPSPAASSLLSSKGCKYPAQPPRPQRRPRNHSAQAPRGRRDGGKRQVTPAPHRGRSSGCAVPQRLDPVAVPGKEKAGQGLRSITVFYS